MRLVTFVGDGPELGVLHAEWIVRPAAALRAARSRLGSPSSNPESARLPENMVGFFQAGAGAVAIAEEAVYLATEAWRSGDPLIDDGRPVMVPMGDARLLAPVPRPQRIRDYLTYGGHAKGSGLEATSAMHAMPICYEANPNSVIGPDVPLAWPSYTDQLDFELEIGFFTSTGGRDLSPEQAANHIAGVTIFNDVSARDVQFFEMSMSLGPSKGKSFCNAMGPCVVTADEIDEWDIQLTASVNGEVWASGTTADRQFSFAEVLAWASLDEDIYPGEFLAVGTIAGGCGLELDRWIRPGDVVELEAAGIGLLRNPVASKSSVPDGAGVSTFTGAPIVPSARLSSHTEHE